LVVLVTGYGELGFELAPWAEIGVGNFGDALPQAIAPLAPSAQKGKQQHGECFLLQIEVSGEDLLLFSPSNARASDLAARPGTT
jgi:hypothetical protein